MAFLFSSSSAVKRPEENQKIIKGEDFWSYRLAAEIVHDAFLRDKQIVHAAEDAYLREQSRGYKDGQQKAQAELAEHMMNIVNGTVSYLAETETQFAMLVHDAVKQIITEYDDKEKTLAVVKTAVGAMRGQKQIVLKVNPEKVDLVTSELQSIHQTFPVITHIEVVGQANIAEDACVVTTEIGSAEASIASQLGALKTSLHRVFGLAKNVAPELEPAIEVEDSSGGEHILQIHDEAF